MEVAGHWRRQWAGTAEYGKVTEGGVTRQVARAMEVVHASAPGARVRVMRAAYHASSAKGAPASSFLMHSSHSVISSGFNLLEAPTTTFSSKPLEISSTPLESSPERNIDTENYKVTEPDDYEISEPSKWKSLTGRRSDRNSSEESSSTDNASIIDLDGRHKNFMRKYSYDSENSDVQIFKGNSARMSPLLDEPVALSTLKYKSLLSGNNDWNNRRKSYSFEKTSSNEAILPSNETLVMSSSTDSGICKSTELINDSNEKNNDAKLHKSSPNKEYDSFKSWLSENRTSTYNKNIKSHGLLTNNNALHSSKKVSVTVPMTVAEDYRPKVATDEESRKLRKVEFSKTELHFTPDTGTVNIIDTDKKPPPSQVFRRRRTELIPLMYDKPVTLLFNSEFYEKNKHNLSENSYSNTSTEENEFDETTTATKSILKNKIPKPKPYLLGENMEFGNSEDSKAKNLIYDTTAPLGVSLINKQLHERGTQKIKSNVGALLDSRRTDDTFRANRSSPFSSLKEEKRLFESKNPTLRNKEFQNNSDRKTNPIPLSPCATRSKTRQLRDSDLTYFGINNHSKTTPDANQKVNRQPLTENENRDGYLHSVRLVKTINGTSQTESSDAPEYQNIPLKTNFAPPIPTPRPRSKFDTKLSGLKEISVLMNIVQLANETKESRRPRTLTQMGIHYSNRSTSAPPKIKPEEKSQQTQRPARYRHRSPEAIIHSPDRSRREPQLIRRSPDRVRRSPDPEHIRTSPERAHNSPEKPRQYCSIPMGRSPERIRRSPDRVRRSPDNLHQSPDRVCRSPDRLNQSPDRVRRSSDSEHALRRSREHIRTSPKRARHSPEKSRQCRSPERAYHSPEKTRQRSRNCGHRSPELHPNPGHTLLSPERASHSPEKTCHSPKLTRRSPERKSSKFSGKISPKVDDVDVKINIDEATYVNFRSKSESGDSVLHKTIHHKLQNGNAEGERVKGKTESNTASFIRNFENRNQDVVHVREKAVSARTETHATPDYTGGKNTNKRMDQSLKKKSPAFRRKSPQKHFESHGNTKPVPTKGEVKKSTIVVENGDTKFNEKSTRRVSPNFRQKPNKQASSLESAEILRGSKHNKICSPQLSKYIINYDDKNGTVSSVCKVKPDNSPLKKKSPKEKNRESPKENKLKIKATDKIALLQSADNQRDPCELTYADRKWKRKMHVQRTCQLL